MASLFVYLPRITLDYLKKRIPSITDESRGVNQDELDNIEYVNLNHNSVDVMYLQYFRNLHTLVIDGFPGTDDRNFAYIARNCPKLTTLVIKGQPKLTKIDLTRFSNLKNISIISNENLVEVVGLEKGSPFINQLDKIEFYDNVSYHKEDDLVENLGKMDKKRTVELDALYYIDANEDIKGFGAEANSYDWHEKIGFVNQVDLSYSSGEMEVAYNYARSIVDTITKPSDTVEMKIFVIYTWILKNIRIQDKREKDLNEGIVNVFKYRVASVPTIAKYFQFLLRVAGIESYDINVLPRVKFNTTSLGTFKIPSEDYEIVKIPMESGNYYFDIAWDNDIYKKTGKISTAFMFNGLRDTLYNHQLIFDSLDNPTDTMSHEEREGYSRKASKRLQNVKNIRIDEISSKDENIVEKIIAGFDFMQANMKRYLESVSRIRDKRKKLEDKIKNGKATFRTEANIKNLDLMLSAIESSNTVLRENIYRLEKLLFEKLTEEDLSYIEVRLGDVLSPFKRERIADTNYVKVTKTKDDLQSELSRIRSALNREVNNREISILEYRTIMDKVTKIYTYLITFAYEKSIIMDSMAGARTKKVA